LSYAPTVGDWRENAKQNYNIQFSSSREPRLRTRSTLAFPPCRGILPSTRVSCSSIGRLRLIRRPSIACGAKSRILQERPPLGGALIVLNLALPEARIESRNNFENEIVARLRVLPISSEIQEQTKLSECIPVPVAAQRRRAFCHLLGTHSVFGKLTLSPD